jgi:hypothetical protein
VIFVGIDWSESRHDVCIVDEQGTYLGGGKVSDDVSGVGRMHAMIAEHAEDPSDVAVGIETDRGLLVGALVEAGYHVFAINPMAASRYRDRYAVSRATGRTTVRSPVTPSSPRP